MRRVDEDAVRELEQPPNRREQLACQRLRLTLGMQVRPAYVADEERVAGEDQPRLVIPPAAVGNHVRVVCRRVTRGPDYTNDGVAQLNDVTVSKLGVRELDVSAGRKVGGGAGRFDDFRQSGDVVGLYVRLEDRDDRRATLPGGGEIRVDELRMRIDDGQLRGRETAEQVARAGGLAEEEGAEDHLARTLKA